jgi:hypothetical protein
VARGKRNSLLLKGVNEPKSFIKFARLVFEMNQNISPTREALLKGKDQYG